MAGRPRTQLKKVSEFEERARKLWQDFAAVMPAQYRDESKGAGPTAELWRAANTDLCAAMTTLEFLVEALDARVRNLPAGAEDGMLEEAERLAADARESD